LPDGTDAGYTDRTGGPDGAPRSRSRRTGRRIAGLVVTAIVVVGVVEVIGHLPSNTGSGSVALRAGVGLGLGLVIILIVRRMLHALTEQPPPPPETVDARTSEVVYVCNVCGTRVRLEVAATTNAPRHCGEEMEPQLARQ
jgi:dipeptide/tripeptide permease